MNESSDKPNQMEVKNLMENAVKFNIKKVMSEMDMCMCERCMSDVTALSLNDLPPKYVAHTAGDVYATVDIASEQGQAQVLTAIIRAAERVQANPRH